MPSQRVLVIGGGLAGQSCAVALAEAGFGVRLFEKRPHLGGRATSYSLPDGSEVDNCQHVTLGCCTNLADFYRRSGAEGKIRFYDRLYFADARGRRFEMQASALFPPPLHFGPSFLRFGAFAFRDKRAIAEALFAIARSGGETPGAGHASDPISMLEWLHRMHQTPDAIERFWRVVLVSALDEDLARTDARYGIEVFWKAFLGSRSGYRVGIPSVPLAELYEGCRASIQRRGGDVRLRCGVREIRIENNRFTEAILEDGSQVTADACVVAVPHDVAMEILPREMAEEGGVTAGLRHLKTSPITSVHMWFDREVMTEPFLALLDQTTQWIFNKTLLYLQAGQDLERRPVSEKGQYLQMVISASYSLVLRSRQDIIELCRREIADVLPATREASLKKATVIKEVNATFSPEPGVDHWRPSQNIGVDGLFLAGDWTRTGWPSTMEGAVRSGYLAADAVLAALEPFDPDRQAFLRPDLPLEGFSKKWASRKKASGQ